MVDSKYKTNVKNAREAIASLIDTVKLCGWQNIPLQCHRDNTKNQPEEKTVLLMHETAKLPNKRWG